MILLKPNSTVILKIFLDLGFDKNLQCELMVMDQKNLNKAFIQHLYKNHIINKQAYQFQPNSGNYRIVKNIHFFPKKIFNLCTQKSQ